MPKTIRILNSCFISLYHVELGCLFLHMIIDQDMLSSPILLWLKILQMSTTVLCDIPPIFYILSTIYTIIP